MSCSQDKGFHQQHGWDHQQSQYDQCDLNGLLQTNKSDMYKFSNRLQLTENMYKLDC